MPAPLLEVLNLSLTGTKVQDVSFALSRGEGLVLWGPNGSGKSTLLKTILGLLPPSSGRVMVWGQDPYRNPWVRHKISMAFQERILDPNLRIETALLRHARLIGAPKERFQAILVRLKLPLGKRLFELSGGEHRKTEVAKAFLHEAALYLLDEPTAELDEEGRSQVKELLGEALAAGSSLIVATHDPDIAALLSKRVDLGMAAPKFYRGRVWVEKWPHGLLGELAQLPIRFTPHPSPETLSRLGLPALLVKQMIFYQGSLSEQPGLPNATLPEEAFMENGLLEVEGPSEEHLLEAVRLLLQKGGRIRRLELEGGKSWSGPSG